MDIPDQARPLASRGKEVVMVYLFAEQEWINSYDNFCIPVRSIASALFPYSSMILSLYVIFQLSRAIFLACRDAASL